MTINPIQIFEGQRWVERLGWALVHFVWQGIVVAVLYATVRRGLGQARSTQTRYILACTALVAMVAAPVVTFSLSGASASASVHSSDAGVSAMTAASAIAATPAESLPVPSYSNAMSWFVMAWFAGAIMFWARLMGGWVVAARMRTMLVRPASAEWQRSLDRLCVRVRVFRPVRLLVSALVQVPTVVGWLRPVVLMPVGALAGLPVEHVEALLAHELAHIRRHDYLVNILQSIAEALLFYHPAVWWISNHIRNEREMCCDDVAVGISGDAIVYARALAELESYRPAHFTPVLAADGGSLPERIGRLLGFPRKARRTLPGSGVIAAAGFIVIVAWGLFAQPAQERQAFEVASVKLNMETNGVVHPAPQVSGNRVTWRNIQLGSLAYYAYHVVGPYQVVGNLQLPAGHNWYDIEAVAPGPPGDDDLRAMFQTMLEDRFKLRVHRETKELSGYDLAVAKSGPKLKAAQSDSKMTVNGKPDGKPVAEGTSAITMNVEGRRLLGKGVSMAQMAPQLGRYLGAPVEDHTGLTGLFDYNVLFAADDDTSGLSTAPDLMTALQDSLGLKLEKSKVSVELLVVDHLEMPTEN